jgi:hypothetical protein
MSLTLTIAGTNYLPQYKTNSATITEQLQNRCNVLRLQITKNPNQSAPSQGMEIVLKDGSRFLFGGFVSRVSPAETGVGQLFVYDIEATDYTYVINNKVAQESYSGQTLGYIVNDLVTKYVNSGYALTINNVDTGPTITTVSFNHIDLRKCFEKLTALTGYVWWVDFEKDIHFKPSDDSCAPEEITDSSNNFMDIQIDTDLTQIRNFIYVKGGTTITDNYSDQSFKGDGTAVSFPLEQVPVAIQSIKLNGVSRTFGQDPDGDAGKYFMWNANVPPYVRVVVGNPIPSPTDVIVVSYKYAIPIITPMRSSNSVNVMKALEGGDGIHAYVIDDASITSKDEARQRAIKELIQYANPLVNGFINTRTGILQAGSYFHTGQQITLNLPSWGIMTDTNFLIQEVQTTLIEDGVNIEYNYFIRFGGKLLNAVSFLESLATPEIVATALEQVDRVELIDEEVIIGEVITRNPKIYSVAESATMTESISKSNTTPPWKYAPSGTKQAKWNGSEWS